MSTGPQVVGAIHRGEAFSVSDADVAFFQSKGLAGEVYALCRPDSDAWTTRHRRLQMRAMRLASATSQATSALDAAGVPSLVYKGIATAVQTGADWRLRQSVDVDVLVSPDAVEQAGRALAVAGRTRGSRYRPAGRVTRWARPEEPWVAKDLPTVDLHWRVESNAGLFRLPFEQLYAGRTTVSAGGIEFPTLALEPAALACAVHGTRELWRQWKGLLDLARYCDRVDLDRLQAMAQDVGARRSLAIGLAALHLCGVDVPAPDPAALSIARDMLTGPEATGWARKRRNRRVKFRSADSLWVAVDGLARSLVLQVVGPRT